MNRWSPPSSASTFLVMPGYFASRSVRTSRSVAPSAPTRASPPACLRRIVGSLTVTDMSVGLLASLGSGGHAAERLVVDQLRDRGLLAADRAVGVPPDPDLLEAHVQGVVQQQPALQGLALAREQLDRLGRLDRADHARQ